MIDYIALKQYVLQGYRLPETFLYVFKYLMNRFIVIVVFMASYFVSYGYLCPRVKCTLSGHHTLVKLSISVF
jgi:hypothetical protein